MYTAARQIETQEYLRLHQLEAGDTCTWVFITCRILIERSTKTYLGSTNFTMQYIFTITFLQ